MMVDIHAHLLPGIDDGPKQIALSIEMARHAVADGITHLVVTPHIHPGRYNNTIKTIRPVFDAYVKQLRQHDISLQLAMASEVRICPEIIPMINSRLIPLYQGGNGQQSMLLELPYAQIPPGYEKIIAWLKQRDIRIVLAHPERNKALMREPGRLKSFIELGCVVQVTAGSITGQFGDGARSCAEYFLKQEWVHIIATDAHNMRSRPPAMKQGRSVAESISGQGDSEALVSTNPWSIVGGMFAS